MPTGYTCIVQEGATFEDFVWRCARAFGALILMRDDPLDAPIPEKFEPSKFYADKVEEHRTEVRRLTVMSHDERVQHGQQLKAEAIARYEKYLADTAEENAKYQAMLERVREWQPPTPEHKGLKDFMIEQLTISISSPAYFENELAKAHAKAPGEFFADALHGARRGVVYAHEERRKEEERAAERNRWVAELRQSVPPPTPNAKA